MQLRNSVDAVEELCGCVQGTLGDTYKPWNWQSSGHSLVDSGRRRGASVRRGREVIRTGSDSPRLVRCSTCFD